MFNTGPDNKLYDVLGVERSISDAELKKKYSEYEGELSMGMSDDYEIALDYGATIIRVGSKIFT